MEKKKKIREIVREEVKAAILFYVIPVDVFTFFALNGEVKNSFVTMVILCVFSLAALTSFVLRRVIDYLEEKEKEHPETLIDDNKYKNNEKENKR